VAAGMGLGVLHRFAAAEDERLVQLFPESTPESMPGSMEVWRSYWLVMHADLQRLPRVRAAADFLDEVMRTVRDRL